MASAQWLDMCVQTTMAALNNATESVWSSLPPELVEHLAITRQAVILSGEAARLWGRVFYPLFAFICLCLRALVDFINPWWPVFWKAIKNVMLYISDLFMTYAWPNIVRRSNEVYQKLLAQDPWTVFVVCSGLVMILYVYWCIRWFLRQNYLGRTMNYLLDSYYRTYNRVERILVSLKMLRPLFHVAFAGHAIFYMGNQRKGGHLSGPHPVAFWLCAVVLPAVLSFRELHAAKTKPHYDGKGVLHWLKYWAVVGSGAVILELPFMERIVCSVRIIMATRVHVVIWLWFGYTNGADIIYNIIAPIIYTLVLQWIPSARGKFDAIVPFVCHYLAPILPSGFKRILSKIEASLDVILELWPLAPCIPIIFMAGFFNMWSGLYCGLVFPIYSIVIYLSEAHHQPISPDPTEDQSEANDKPSKKPVIRWLTYFTVFAPYKMIHYHLGYWLSGVIGWYNSYTFLVLWLLFSLANDIVEAIDDMCTWSSVSTIALKADQTKLSPGIMKDNATIPDTPIVHDTKTNSANVSTLPIPATVYTGPTAKVLEGPMVPQRQSRNVLVNDIDRDREGAKSTQMKLRQRANKNVLSEFKLGIKAAQPPPGEDDE